MGSRSQMTSRRTYLQEWHRQHPTKRAEYFQQRKARAALYQRNRSRRIKLEFIRMKGGQCTDCHMDLLARPECGQFDHRAPAEKSFNIRWHVGQSPDSIKQELEKCDLVCANCHFTRTVSRYEDAAQYRLAQERRQRQQAGLCALSG